MSKSMTVKKFIALSCEAIEGLSKNDARQAYKSIKTYKNKSWLKFQDAEDALSLKVELNEEIEELEDELDENPNNTDKITNKLNQLLSKPSTLSLIRDLEIGFNKKPGTFAQISKTSKINPNLKKNFTNKPKKHLIASTTNDTTQEDESDEDDEMFSFSAYMKLREKNMGNNENTNKNTLKFTSKNKNMLQNNIIYENTVDTNTNNNSLYPVDQNANYNIIAAHFKFDTTKNQNIDHSELDFDDLQSLKLDEASSSDDGDDEYADSQSESMTHKNTESTQSDHRWSVDDIKQTMDDSDSSDEQKSEIKTDVFGSKKSEKSEIKMDNLNEKKSEKSEIKTKRKKKPPSPRKKMKKMKPHKKSKKKKKNLTVENDDDDGDGEIGGELKLVSSMEVTWNKLSDRALNDNNWNDEDCEKLIDEACVVNKKEVFIHSMWLIKCKEYCNKHKNKTKHMKFGVIIGYPSGQQCVAAKMSEIKYCLKHKIDKIVLYVCCGKIIDRDWKYIKKEVTSVNKVIGKKCALQVKHPKSEKISAQTSAVFQQTVNQIIDQ